MFDCSLYMNMYREKSNLYREQPNM
jgi:hypothetical protein